MRFYRALLFALFALAIATLTPIAEPAEAYRPPNVIVIMTDDLSVDELNALGNFERQLASQGAKFEDSFNTYALCCPSRSSFLTGMYTHNHKVWTNRRKGGLQSFKKEGHERHHIGKWMANAGYRTVYIGKYMNGYNTGYKPRHWQRWYGYLGAYKWDKHRFYENNHVETYTKLDTTVMKGKALKEIREADDAGKPLFMVVMPNAPHAPAPYAPGDADSFRYTRLPKPPSYDEQDLSDKPQWVQEKAGLSPEHVKEMTALYRNKLRSMGEVRRLYNRVVETLRERGELNRTYIVFTSDNGYHMGQHALPRGKNTPYEEDIRVPLYVRGPGVQPGSKPEGPALNIDLSPTILSWANAPIPASVDGRSLKEVLTGHRTNPREVFLTEGYYMPIPGYQAARYADGRMYVEYSTGEREYYNLNHDPYQLENQVGSLSPEDRADLKARLNELRKCAGQSCREAEKFSP